MDERNPAIILQSQPDTLERPSQVSERLGISTAMLRRHVASYEKVFGDLLKDKRDGRLYTREVSDRLEAALALYHAQRVPSVEEGLRRIAVGDANTGDTLEVARAEDPMTLLFEELRRLREATERQNELFAEQGTRMDRLKAENRAFRQALPEPQQESDAPKRPWWQLWNRQ